MGRLLGTCVRLPPGFILRTQRHVYRCNEDGTADRSLATIMIRIESVAVQRRCAHA